MFAPLREKLEALWRLDPTNCRPVEVHVLYSYLAWQREREKPRFWHYLQRVYRRHVLPRKEWRLPWR